MRTASARPWLGPTILIAAIAAVWIEDAGVALGAAWWLLPSVGSLLVEREPGRPMTRAMASFGLAVSAGDLWRLWDQGGGVDLGLAACLDPTVVARAWAAQGGAWLLAEIIPLWLITRAERAARVASDRLEAARRELADEWTPASPAP